MVFLNTRLHIFDGGGDQGLQLNGDYRTCGSYNRHRQAANDQWIFKSSSKLLTLDYWGVLSERYPGFTAIITVQSSKSFYYGKSIDFVLLV